MHTPRHAVKAARDNGIKSRSGERGTTRSAIQPNKVYEAVFIGSPSSNKALK